jgi:hypothetical protein
MAEAGGHDALDRLGFAPQPAKRLTVSCVTSRTAARIVSPAQTDRPSHRREAMTPKTYAVSMDCPHATRPEVLWSVDIWDVSRPTPFATSAVDFPHCQLWVPRLETWTLDSLRMLLHELDCYLPVHELNAATVTITAAYFKRGGRAAQSPKPPRFDNKSVTIAVSARGFSAKVHPDRMVRNEKGEGIGRYAGDWSEPMQAVLLDLASKSPFPLAAVGVVDSADPDALNLKQGSRRDVGRGLLEDINNETYEERIRRLVRKMIKDLDDELGGRA